MKREQNLVSQAPIKQIGLQNLISYFHSLEESEGFPFDLALASLEELEATVQTDGELLRFFLEDIVFTSLYATFYEQLLLGINGNQSFARQLANEFYKETESRDQIIAAQAHNHIQYVEAFGFCMGCNSCSNHKDVEDLVEYWKKSDMDFFITLYLGMQTIQFTFDQLLEDIISTRSDLLKDLSYQNVLSFRKYIFEYTSKS